MPTCGRRRPHHAPRFLSRTQLTFLTTLAASSLSLYDQAALAGDQETTTLSTLSHDQLSFIVRESGGICTNYDPITNTCDFVEFLHPVGANRFRSYVFAYFGEGTKFLMVSTAFIEGDRLCWIWTDDEADVFIFENAEPFAGVSPAETPSFAVSFSSLFELLLSAAPQNASPLLPNTGDELCDTYAAQPYRTGSPISFGTRTFVNGQPVANTALDWLQSDPADTASFFPDSYYPRLRVE